MGNIYGDSNKGGRNSPQTNLFSHTGRPQATSNNTLRNYAIFNSASARTPVPPLSAPKLPRRPAVHPPAPPITARQARPAPIQPARGGLSGLDESYVPFGRIQTSHDQESTQPSQPWTSEYENSDAGGIDWSAAKRIGGNVADQSAPRKEGGGRYPKPPSRDDQDGFSVKQEALQGAGGDPRDNRLAADSSARGYSAVEGHDERRLVQNYAGVQKKSQAPTKVGTHRGGEEARQAGREREAEKVRVLEEQRRLQEKRQQNRSIDFGQPMQRSKAHQRTHHEDAQRSYMQKARLPKSANLASLPTLPTYVDVDDGDDDSDGMGYEGNYHAARNPAQSQAKRKAPAAGIEKNAGRKIAKTVLPLPPKKTIKRSDGDNRPSANKGGGMVRQQKSKEEDELESSEDDAYIKGILHTDVHQRAHPRAIEEAETAEEEAARLEKLSRVWSDEEDGVLEGENEIYDSEHAVEWEAMQSRMMAKQDARDLTKEGKIDKARRAASARWDSKKDDPRNANLGDQKFRFTRADPPSVLPVKAEPTQLDTLAVPQFTLEEVAAREASEVPEGERKAHWRPWAKTGWVTVSGPPKPVDPVGKKDEDKSGMKHLVVTHDRDEMCPSSGEEEQLNLFAARLQRNHLKRKARRWAKKEQARLALTVQLDNQHLGVEQIEGVESRIAVNADLRHSSTSTEESADLESDYGDDDDLCAAVIMAEEKKSS